MEHAEVIRIDKLGLRSCTPATIVLRRMVLTYWPVTVRTISQLEVVVDAIVLAGCVPENQLLGVPIETDDGVIVAAASKKSSERRAPTIRGRRHTAQYRG